MAKESAHFRDVESIAAAWGIKLYEQRPRKLKQLAELRTITEHPQFPAKVKGKGWPRAAVVQFGMEWVSVDANKREFRLLAQEKAKPKPPEPQELPEQPKPPEGDLFPQDKSAFERSLDMWQEKLENPEKWIPSPIQKWQLDLLRQHRPQLFASSERSEATIQAESENISGGVRGVANWIRNNYPHVAVDHVKVQRWQRGEYLPPGCKENFPASDASGSGRFKTAEVTAWVERYCPAVAVGQELPMNIAALRDQAEAEQIAHDRWLRNKERGMYVRADAVEAYVRATAQRDAQATDKLIEDRNGLRKAVRLALASLLADEQVEQVDAALAESFRAENDKLKDGFAASRQAVLDELEKLKADEKPKI